MSITKGMVGGTRCKLHWGDHFMSMSSIWLSAAWIGLELGSRFHFPERGVGRFPLVQVVQMLFYFIS